MESDDKDEKMQTTAILILIALLLPMAAQSHSKRIPYNDLELSGASYAQSIVNGNPRRCVSVLRVPASNFKFVMN